MSGPLGGVRVVDLTRALAGPYATMMLADAGADVVKVERPGSGDDTRGWGPPFLEPDGNAGGRESAYFLSVNRGKRSVELDLKDAHDLQRLRALIRDSDVLAENFRPGVLEKLGLGEQQLAQLNARLVVLSITGFGEGGPDGHRPGFDQIVQGEGGLMSLTGPSSGPPTKVGVPIADILAGMFGAFGVVASLHERTRSGRGQWVRTSLLGGMVAIHTFQGTRWLLAGEVPGLSGNRHPTIAPYGAYECADGTINIAAGSEGLWHRLAPLVGIDPNDDRFATNSARVQRVDDLEAAMRPALAAAGIEEWMRRLDEAGVPAGRVRSLDEVYDSAQVAHLGLVEEVQHATLGRIRLPGSPLSYSRSRPDPPLPPPALGEHDDEGSFQPWDDDVVSSDLLGFVDTVAYPERLARARADAGTTEAVVTGRATCHGHDVVILAGAFAFLAGTQGIAVGERVTRAFERARDLSLPVVGLPRSGGTRMQEGTLAFVQMAKIAAAVAQFRAGGGCYVSYLRDPTLGGVLASWGALGAITFAEPSALVGLTGPRVVELLTGEPFPKGVMVAEHLHSHGVVDDVVAPRQLAERVARVLAVAVTSPDPQPTVVIDEVAVEAPSAWACVEATRAPDRPGVRDVLARWASDVTLLTGDGAGGDDRGCLVALCRLAGIPAVVVGADRRAPHRGASLGAQGYRKARRGMELAGELGLPLVTLIDTQGAQANARSEEGGLAREIGRCLMAMSQLPVPTVSVLLGEGSGGGAIALLPADRTLAAQDAWLAPIAPEGAAAILFRTTDEAPRLAGMQAITASQLQLHGIVDEVVAGSDAPHLVERVGAAVAAELRCLAGRDRAELLASRQSRLRRIGGATGARA